MKPTLLVLAAGMGSRYGGLKQMDGLGPHGETIIDYSIYDAVLAGFGKVVYIVREYFLEQFRQNVSEKYGNVKCTDGTPLKFEFVTQELDRIPSGFSVNPEREKPWGTAHAVLMAARTIHEPFAVINGDDFYGRESFRIAADWCNAHNSTTGTYAIVGFALENTLSENGSVSRGVCEMDAQGLLLGMTERTAISRTANGIEYKDADGSMHPLASDATVSMNLFGFTPDYFGESEKLFVTFLKEKGQEMKSEYYIPYAVNTFIANGYAKMKVLKTTAQWFGVTYKEDRPSVVARLKELHDQGIY